ncbi:polyketide synthase [Penicillium cf. viridicatum]|uniref:Polyketide synthase n=1 Tax=Penicillium cf. viridicatum TaxID=2972119 RepID=A0A9W9IQF3_9EURO|nr:polyketide synthase [Penicillium cf. viridicatum]
MHGLERADYGQHVVPRSNECHVISHPIAGAHSLGNVLASALKHEQSAGLPLTFEDHASWLAANLVPAYLTSHPSGCNIAIIGLDVHRKVPPDRFDVDAHTDPSGNGKNKSHTPYGCFIEEPGKFDPRFFNMSPREAKQTDPMQPLAITTAYEAMESAGFVLNRTPSTDARRVGTFYGQTSNDWREINAAENIDTYFITGGVRAFGPGRINYHFGFSGPRFGFDTAWSSSFAATQLACTSLRARDCDTVFAGRMNVLTNPDIFAGLSKGQFLSKTGSCKTFDHEADGYCRGDGVVTVILKRVEDAIAENDPILGVIRGTATNYSADAVSITPTLSSICFRRSWMTSAPTHARHQPLYIGSAKANIGHRGTVSGVLALVKVMLIFQKDLIPPHWGIKGFINQGFPSDLQARGVHIASQLTSSPRGGKRRMAFINNFCAAGCISAMLVEDAPERPVVELNDNSDASVTSSVVTVSAKSLASLDNNTKSLLAWIDQNPAISLADLAYTTTARRAHYTYHAAFAIDSVPHLRQKLQAYIEKGESPRAISQSHPPSIAFVFTGQGAKYSGFPSFLSIIDGSMTSDLGTQSPIVTQLASTSLQMALDDLWKSWGVVPFIVLGHSLGDYAALYVAGVLSAMNRLFLVGRRAQLLEPMCMAQSDGMLAVEGHITATELMHLINDTGVGVACLNSRKETVLAGPVEVMTRARQTLTAVRPALRCIPLTVSFAFHSAQVDPTLEPLAQVAESIVFHPPRIPILSPVTRSVIDRADIGLCFATAKGAGVEAISASLSTLYQAGVAINWNEVHAGLVQTQSVQVLWLPSYSFDEKNYWLDYTNNWTLNKGEMVSQTPPPERKFPTTSIQRIFSKLFRPDGLVEVVAESDLHEPNLKALISGHQVGGAPLYPLSLNADMAFTIAKYTFELVNHSTETTLVPHMNICKMESAAPLILNMQQTSQLLIVKSVYDPTHSRCQVSFHSGTIQHAHCQVRFEDEAQWAAEFHRRAFLVHSRIQSLQQRGDGTSGVHMLYRGMTYKLFTALVDYSPTFQ